MEVVSEYRRRLGLASNGKEMMDMSVSVNGSKSLYELGMELEEWKAGWRVMEAQVRAEREAQELAAIQQELDRLAAVEALKSFFELFGFAQSLERIQREVMEGAASLAKATAKAEADRVRAEQEAARVKEENRRRTQEQQAAALARDEKEAAKMAARKATEEYRAANPLPQGGPVKVPVVQVELPVKVPVVLEEMVKQALQPAAPVVEEAPSYFDSLLDRLTVVQAMVTVPEVSAWEEQAEKALAEMEARHAAETAMEREVRVAREAAFTFEVKKLQERRQELVEEKFQLGMALELVIPEGQKFVPRHERSEGARDYPKLAGQGWQELQFTEGERYEKGTVLEDLQFTVQRKARLAKAKLDLAEKELGRNAGLIQFVRTLITEGQEARQQFHNLLAQCRERKARWLELAEEIREVNRELISLNRRR